MEPRNTRNTLTTVKGGGCWNGGLPGAGRGRFLGTTKYTKYTKKGRGQLDAEFICDSFRVFRVFRGYEETSCVGATKDRKNCKGQRVREQELIGGVMGAILNHEIHEIHEKKAGVS
jgi:hypothetical protein